MTAPSLRPNTVAPAWDELITPVLEKSGWCTHSQGRLEFSPGIPFAQRGRNIQREIT